MTYEDTGLPPEDKLLRKAYVIGVQAYAGMPDAKERMETAVRLAHMMIETWPEEGEVEGRNYMIAAVLAGPAVFTSEPTTDLGQTPVSKARDVMAVQDVITSKKENMMEALRSIAPTLAPEVRQFLQCSAIITLEKLLAQSIDVPAKNQPKVFISTLQTFTALDMGQDEFGLKALFEETYRKSRGRISFTTEDEKLAEEAGMDPVERIFQMV